MFLSVFPQQNTGSTNYPKSATLTQINNYPANGQVLPTSATSTGTNFTTQLRDATWERSWDTIAALNIYKDGVLYNNLSVLCGNYNASLTFNNVTEGAQPTGGWTHSIGAGGSIYVQNEWMGHRKVLKIEDAGAGASGSYHDYIAPATGSIEFWWACSTTDTAACGNMFLLYDALGNNLINFLNSYSHAGSLDYYTTGGGTHVHDVGTFTANTWVHFRFDFDTGADTVTIYINGVNVLAAHALTNPGNAPTRNHFGVGAAAGISNQYFDAIDYSWDSTWTGGWTAGRNSYVSLNVTTGFSVEGSYSYAWTVFCAGVAYTAASVSFSVVESANVILNATPAEADIRYPFQNLTFAQNISISFGVPSSAKLLIQKPNGAQIIYSANCTTTGSIAELNKTITGLNVTGTYSYLFTYANYTPIVAYSWITFRIIDNVQIISESTSTTRWVFSDYNRGSWSNLYTANFGTESYHLDNALQVMQFLWADVTGDSYVDQRDPGTNYGSDTSLWVVDNHWWAFGECWIYLEDSRLNNYLLRDGLSYIYMQNIPGMGDMITNHLVYTTTSFNEGTITWNNKPALSTLVNTVTPYTDFEDRTVSSTIASPYFSIVAECQGGVPLVISSEWHSSESGTPTYRPEMYHNVSKFYRTTGLTYIQTNTTESLMLSSHTFAIPLELRARDRVTITFNTSSTHQINFLTSYEKSTVATRELVAEGNANFGTQTKVFTLGGNEKIDALNFTGTFESAKNLQITSILIDRPSFPYSEHYVDPDGQEYTSMNCTNYTLDVYETGDSSPVYTHNITISNDTLNIFVYTPTNPAERQVNVWDDEGNLLDFALFNVYINYTWEGAEVLSTSPIDTNRFYADDLSTYNLTITDKFGNLLDSPRVDWTITTFIDITLTGLYSLKIQNNMITQTTINLILNSSTQSEVLLVGEIDEFLLYSGNYTLNYTQTETGIPISATISVYSATFYIINTSYSSTYISCYSPNNPAIPRDQFRLYVNNTFWEWGFVYLLSDPWNITIYDWFNNTAYTEIHYLNATSELNIPITVHSFKLQNQMRTDTLANISQNGISFTRYVMSGEVQEVFLTSGIYSLNYTNTELSTEIITTFTINTAMMYVINSSYFNIYVTAWDGYTEIPLDKFLLKIDGVERPMPGYTELLAGNHNFQVTDWFGANLYSAVRGIVDATPIRLPLAVFSLKIQNLMKNDTYFRLNSPGGVVERWLLSGDTEELWVGDSNYQLQYTQTETNTLVVHNFHLTSAMRIVINTSYHTTYFSAFSNDLLGIPTDSVRLYINSTRQNWGPVSLLGTGQNITVLDYFNETLYTTILTDFYSEYNVFVNMASLSLYNNQSTEYLRFNITKSNITLLSQVVAPQQFLSFRFVNGTYNVSAYYQDGTLYRSEIVVIDINSSQLISFGVLAPDYTAVYASEIYIYALFRDQINWSTDVDENALLFYKVNIINYKNISGIVYFDYNGMLVQVPVSAMVTYPDPLYVPKGAKYSLYDADSNQFLTDWIDLADNATSDAYAEIEFGFWSEKYEPNVIDETSLMMYMIVTGTAFAIVIAIAIAMSYKYSNAKNSKRRSVVT